MENGIWFDVLKEAVTVISGVLLAGVSTLGGFYVKRLTDKMKMNTLREDISDYVHWAEQSPSFTEFTGKEKFELVYHKAMENALENGVSISEGQLAILVESKVKTMKMKEGEGSAIRQVVKGKIVNDIDETSGSVIETEKAEENELDLDLEPKG